TSSAAASSAITAALARPSTGGAVTCTVSAPSSRQPPITAREARGCTRTRSRRASSARVAGIGLVGGRLAREQAGVAIEHPSGLPHGRGGHALGAHGVSADPTLFGARGLDRLLAGQFRLAQDQLGLAARVVLHLLDEALRGDERLLKRPLPLGDATRALLLRGDLLLQQRRLLEHGLIVFGHVVEECVDLLRVVALEHLRRELLLANVVRGDAHRGLPPYPRLYASW